MSNEFLMKIKLAWEKYITEGKQSKDVHPIIARSWQRCLSYGVDPNGGTGYSVSEELMTETMKKNSELLRIARPIMENLNSLVLGTGFILVLTDRDGIILDLIGEVGIRENAKKLQFSPGSLWSEEKVGTNAIGTCIKEDKPMQVIGAEHFCKEHHSWTCSAAPIHDSEGEIIGVLDMSGNSYGAHRHTLGIVVAAAFSIENQIRLSQSYALIDTTVEYIADGMMVIDKNFRITKINRAGEKILGLNKGEISGIDFRKMIGENIFLHTDMPKGNMIWDFAIKNQSITCSVKVTPINLDNNLTGHAILFKEIKDLQETVNVITGNNATYTFDNILTVNKKMNQAIKQAQKFSRTRGCVLIEGESGTGKELFAHSIHNHSNYQNGPFVAINCASLPRDLVESELFGYEKGAFTGAVKEGKIGKFELANGGTIFLDEIGELPLDLQAKLLRVLDNHTITRIGGKIPKKLDVRVVVATNRNLLEEVKKKNFREDLYYRLNVFKVNIPPLRERPEDIKVLVDNFLNRLNKGNNTKKILHKNFINDIKGYNWNGNVRELQNIVERAYHLCEGKVITSDLVPDEIIQQNNDEDNFNALSIRKKEKEIIEKALRKTNGQVILASELLGLSKSTLYRKIKEYEISTKMYNNNL